MKINNFKLGRKEGRRQQMNKHHIHHEMSLISLFISKTFKLRDVSFIKGRRGEVDICSCVLPCILRETDVPAPGPPYLSLPAVLFITYSPVVQKPMLNSFYKLPSNASNE